MALFNVGIAAAMTAKLITADAQDPGKIKFEQMDLVSSSFPWGNCHDNDQRANVNNRVR